MDGLNEDGAVVCSRQLVVVSRIEDGSAAPALPPDGLIVGAQRAEPRLPLSCGAGAHLHGRARRARAALAVAARRPGAQPAQLLLLSMPSAIDLAVLSDVRGLLLAACIAGWHCFRFREHKALWQKWRTSAHLGP